MLERGGKVKDPSWLTNGARLAGSLPDVEMLSAVKSSGQGGCFGPVESLLWFLKLQVLLRNRVESARNSVHTRLAWLGPTWSTNDQPS